MTRKNKIIATAIILIAVVSIFVGVFSDGVVAFATMPSSYTNYINSLPSTDDGDWYFGEDYLNLENCISIVNSWKTDDSFDWEGLKNNPIVIAVVDSGIGYAYKNEDGDETEVSAKEIYGDGVNYKISDVFDDVLLTDENGNYVYTNTTSRVTIVDGKSTSTQTAVIDSGNIALDLVDNTDNNHGTHVTGIVALLIHAFGLEEYIKILPIKANNKLTRATNKTQLVASYDNGNSDPVITNALYFAEENGADIVNLSLAAEYSARAYYTFDAFDNEMLIVAAAGNSGVNSLRVTKSYYPAACTNVIGVMNYTKDDDGKIITSSTSNYGSAYNVAAPGTSIISIIDGDDGYGKLSGTSMASPIVSFCSALTLLRYRGYESETGVEMTTELLRAMVNACPSETTADLKSSPVINLKNLLTADFLNDEDYADEMYTTPTGIKIQTDCSSKLILGGEEVYFKAVPTPSNAKTDLSVRWYLKKGEEKTDLGEGNEITLAVPGEVGEGYAIYCEYFDSVTGVAEYVSEPFTFSVNYKEFVIGDIEDFSVVENEDGAVFSIVLDDYKPSYSEGVVWYVDGVEVGRGTEYAYSEKLSAGEHIITVSVWGMKVDYEFSISVPESESNGISDAVYEIIGIVAGVAFIVFGIVCALTINKKKKAGNSSDYVDVIKAKSIHLDMPQKTESENASEVSLTDEMSEDNSNPETAQCDDLSDATDDKQD